MNLYEICNLIINVEGDYEPVIDKLSDFNINSSDHVDLDLYFQSQPYLLAPDGVVISSEKIVWMRKRNAEEGYYVYTYINNGSGKKIILVIADIDYLFKKIKMTYRNNQEPTENYTVTTQYNLNMVMGILFRHSLIHLNGMVMHASVLDWSGKGILFTAPSGTGKSTQVKLWQTYFKKGVRVLNDDTPAIKFIYDTPYVYGTPWCGSSGIHCNGFAPIAAIIIVEQAPYNSVAHLAVSEAMFRVMPRVFFPYFDQNMMNEVMNLFEKLIKTVPVYLLKCKPEREAVELVYECVK